MQNKNAVLMLQHGQEMMVLPGPEGYKMKWSKGTKFLPMTKSSSGHLIIPCEQYNNNSSSSSSSTWNNNHAEEHTTTTHHHDNAKKTQQ
jgi:hypothetical protein